MQRQEALARASKPVLRARWRDDVHLAPRGVPRLGDRKRVYGGPTELDVGKGNVAQSHMPGQHTLCCRAYRASPGYETNDAGCSELERVSLSCLGPR